MVDASAKTSFGHIQARASAECSDMKRHFRGLIVAVAALACMVLPAAALAQAPTFNQFSNSYFTFDVPNGTLTAKVELTVQNAQQKDLTVFHLWAMPKATGIVVMRGDTVLENKPTALLDADGLPTFVEVKLDRPLKNRARTDIVMTYSVPSQKSELVKMAPGDMELMLTSQGKGSFVYVDVPSEAENYFDPGCLFASSQPEAVKKAGNERWICGDTALIALATEDKETQKRCASGDDKCRQRLTNSTPFAAFAQSISDKSSLSTITGEVQMPGKTITLTLRHFKADQKWAEKQFAVAQAAMPKLEALFGFPYPHDKAQLRQSNFIELVGAAGLAFPNEGDMLIAPYDGEFATELTVHELAHQWAGRNLETSWLWEGLAEWAVHRLAPELGFKPEDRVWKRFGYTDPLATWWAGSTVTNPNYWYGKAGEFWSVYEAAVGGPAVMLDITSRMDDDESRWPLDGRWFMDMGEATGGNNLDALFMEWVFDPVHSAAIVKERRAARDLTFALALRAELLGFPGVPADISHNLSEWSFANVPALIDKGNKALDDYVSLMTESSAAGLQQTSKVGEVWASTPVSITIETIEDQRQAVRAIVHSAERLQTQPEGSVPLQRLAKAREAYNALDYDEAEKLATSALTAVFNGNTAVKLIAAAHEKKDAFSPNYLETIGMLFENPEKDLADAEAALAAGEPEVALKKSKAAYDTWQGAQSRGLMRLAIVAGLMAAMSGGAFWLLKRIDGPRTGTAPARGSVSGHNLGTSDERGTWRDWENTGT